MNESTARNIRVQDRYDELMRIGRHGHYETMFQVVREEIESLRQQLDAKEAEVDDLGDDLAQVKRQLAKRDKQVMLLHFELFNSAEYIDTLGGTSLEARKTLAATEQWK